MTHTHILTRTYTHLPLCHGHTLFIVTDTHHHKDRVLYTYMTSYLDYRLAILIDKSTLFINSWLIRLWVDKVLLISTRSLSIVIDKTIPLSIGISIKSCKSNDLIWNQIPLHHHIQKLWWEKRTIIPFGTPKPVWTLDFEKNFSPPCFMSW